MKRNLPSSLWLMPLLMPLLMGQSAVSCKKADYRPTVKLQRGEDLIMVDFPPNSTAGAFVSDNTDPIDEICVGPDKTVCEWGSDPNVPRAFEQYGPSVGYWPLVDDNPAYTEQLVRCVSPTTHVGICEPWDDLTVGRWNHRAITMPDRGLCSAKLPTDFFVGEILNQFQRQSDLRLGEDILAPEGRDVIMWTDFLYGLKDSEHPFRAWQDYTIGKGFEVTEGLFNGEVASEVVVEGNFYVDGNLEWRFDTDRYGNTYTGAVLAGTLQTLWFANPLTFWTVFLGNCEKDRAMRVRFRGSFEATGEGGVGVRVNTRNNCGPNQDGPCTWAYIYPWPARPICNNQVKPKIEAQFVNGMIAGMTDPVTDKPRCLTCTEDGGSLLPWKLDNGEPIPVRRVVMGPKDIEFVFIDDLADPNKNENFTELSGKGMCGFNRSATQPTPITLKAGGKSL